MVKRRKRIRAADAKTSVYFNGRLIGTHPNGKDLVQRLREKRRMNELNYQVNVFYNERADELHIISDKGRVRRPYIVVEDGKSRLTPEILEKAAQKGDKIAKDAWCEMGIHIGNALAGIINLLNPEVIIIGGGMAEVGNMLFDSIRSAAKRKSMNIQGKAVRIVKARLGNDAGVIGAGEIVKAGVRW